MDWIPKIIGDPEAPMVLEVFHEPEEALHEFHFRLIERSDEVLVLCAYDLSEAEAHDLFSYLGTKLHEGQHYELGGEA